MRNSENSYSAEAALQDTVGAPNRIYKGIYSYHSSSNNHAFKKFSLKKLINFRVNFFEIIKIV